MTAWLKRIDAVAWPVAVVAGGALACVRRNTAPDARMLIARPGGMGDLIMAQIAAEAVGIGAGDARWLIETRSELWARFAGLDYVCYDRISWGTIRSLLGRHPVVINTEQRFGLSQGVAAACRARGGRTFAFSSNRAARFASKTTAYDWRDARECDEFARLFSLAAGRPTPLAVTPRRRHAPATGAAIIGIAGADAPSRQFTEDDLARLAEPWLRGETAVVCCAPRDRGFATQLCQRLGARVTVFSGSFDEMCRLISQSSRLLCVDGGMVHIASYFGVPVTAIFTSGRERKWRPLAAGSAIIRRNDLSCQPCTRFGQTPACPHQYVCKHLTYPDDLRPLAN